MLALTVAASVTSAPGRRYTWNLGPGPTAKSPRGAEGGLDSHPAAAVVERIGRTDVAEAAARKAARCSRPAEQAAGDGRWRSISASRGSPLSRGRHPEKVRPARSRPRVQGGRLPPLWPRH